MRISLNMEWHFRVSSSIWILWELRKTTGKSKAFTIELKMVVCTWRVLIVVYFKKHCYSDAITMGFCLLDFFFMEHFSLFASRTVPGSCHIISPSQWSCSIYYLHNSLFHFSAWGYVITYFTFTQIGDLLFLSIKYFFW